MNFYHQFVSEEINKIKDQLNRKILIRTKENVNFNDIDKEIQQKL